MERTRDLPWRPMIPTLRCALFRRLTTFPFRLFANFEDEQLEDELVDLLLHAWHAPYREDLMSPGARSLAAPKSVWDQTPRIGLRHFPSKTPRIGSNIARQESCKGSQIPIGSLCRVSL
jgi:hypothetical protein